MVSKLDLFVVFAGSGTAAVAISILSHKVGWLLESISERDVERVILSSRRVLAVAADRLLKEGLIQQVPFCVRRGMSGYYLAISETVADLFCETRQVLNFMNGGWQERCSVINDLWCKVN